MENSLEIIQELIEWVKKYSLESGTEFVKLEDFILWINSQIFGKEDNRFHSETESYLDMEMTFLLAMQYKHYKSYAKVTMSDTELTSTDEFSFLYHLNMADSFRKMELIRIHLLEPPSGIEVLKRLLKKEMIEEFDDPDDGRARRVRITTKGKSQTEKLVPKMQGVFQKMSAEMTLNEKVHVISFLQRMHKYHSKAVAGS